MTKCDVIQDLIPLYIDNAASEGSRAEIEDHIKTCENCRELLEKMKSGDIPIHLNADKTEINAFKIIKQKLLRKNVLISFIAIVVTVIVVFFVCIYRIPLQYSPGNMDIRPSNDQKTVTIVYADNYTRVSQIQTGDSVYIGYTNTFWESFFYIKENDKYNNIDTTINIESGTQFINQKVNKIYYFNINKYSVGGKTKNQALADAILIWER